MTNDVIKRALKFTGKVGVIASEEEDKPVFNQDAYKSAPRPPPLKKNPRPPLAPRPLP